MSRPTRKLDKIKAFFRRQHSEPSSSSIPGVPNAPKPPVAPQKGFVKSKNFEKDIVVLSATYIIDQNPDLKSLIHMIISIHENDEEGQLTGILETCAQFSMQLASATKAHRAETTEVITVFRIKIVEKIKMVQVDGSSQSLQALMSMIEAEIAKIKASYPFMHDYDTGTSDGVSKVLGVAIGGSIAVLQVIEEASALAPIPGIQPLIGGVVSLLQASVQARTNYSDMKEIAATAGEFTISCAVICSERTTEPSVEFKQSLYLFTKEFKQIVIECEEVSKLNPLRRHNSQNDDPKAIKERLKIAIEAFQNESHVNLQLDIKEISTKLDYPTLESLPSHPYYNPNEYLYGSRNDVIQYISGWIDEPNEFVLWIHGAAGLGKSTLSEQVVNLLKSGGWLAGGVFLTHLTTEQPQKVIQIISKQLGEMHPLANANIAEAARKLNGPHGTLRDYFTSYIIDPVRALKYSYQLIIVVDSLDEWTNREPFVAELGNIRSPSPVKFILTSRSNYPRMLSIIPLVQSYSLSPVSQVTVERYFYHQFGSPKIDWRGRNPDRGTISRLATKTNGLLIWAATVCSLVSYESDKRYPHLTLNQIMSSEEKKAFSPEPDIRQSLRHFLGGIIILQEALPIRDFARLVNMSDQLAEEIQRRLVAFQTRGNPTGNVLPAIQQFHSSFLEFVQPISVDRPSNAISSFDAHSLLAKQCLKIVFSELLSSRRGQSCIYSDLLDAERYAVKYWPLHVSNGSPRAQAALSSTPLYTTLLGISDAAMRRWGTLFLPCVAARFQDRCGSLDNIPRSVLPSKLAEIIWDDDTSALLHRIHCLEIAVRLQPMDLRSWQVLGQSYHMLHQYGRYYKNLEEEIIVFRQALELVSQTSTESGSLADVDAEVAEVNEIERPTLTQFRVDISTWLANALKTLFEQRGTFNDLLEAISLHREALSLLPAPHPDRSVTLSSLAESLHTRFKQNGPQAPRDLDEAIALQREALTLRPVPHPYRSTSLNDLANFLRARFKKRGASNDLDEAIALHQEALALFPATHPCRSTSLNNLAESLKTRFDRQGSSKDLSEAISRHREALALLPASHSPQPESLNNLAKCLKSQFEEDGTSTDLDEAIALQREALGRLPVFHFSRPITLNDLANSFATRFEAQGASSDLEETISLRLEALTLLSESHPHRPTSLNSLAESLKTRYDKQGTLDDLEQAISVNREALSHFPVNHPHHPRSLNNLAECLKTRFDQQATANDLEQAISLLQRAVLVQPSDHPRYPTILKNLSISLQSRFEKDHLLKDLDEIILLYQCLLDFPVHHSWSLNKLPSALRERYALKGDQKDLDEATRFTDAGVQFFK